MNLNLNAHYHIRLAVTLIVTVLLAFMSLYWIAEVAASGSHEIKSTATCHLRTNGHNIYGRSVTQWSGKPSNTNGQVTGVLWFWGGSDWVRAVSKNDMESGSTATAKVQNIVDAGLTSKTWQQGATHQASFLDGLKTTYSVEISCPP